MSVSGGSGLQSSSLESFIVITRRKIATNSGFWKGMGRETGQEKELESFRAITLHPYQWGTPQKEEM